MSVSVCKFGTMVYVSHDGILWRVDRIELLMTVLFNGEVLRVGGYDIVRLNDKFIAHRKARHIIGPCVVTYAEFDGKCPPSAEKLHRCECALLTFVY
jgi:hypothetical protein